MGAGGQRAGQQGTGQKQTEAARQGRFDGALARARAEEAEPKGTSPLTPGSPPLRQGLRDEQDAPGQQLRDGQTPAGTQIMQVVGPQASGTVAPVGQGAQTHAADIQHLSDRIGTEVRLAEAQALRGPPGATHSLTLDLARNGLGLSTVTVLFGAREVTVTLRLPAGAEAHGFNEATAQLAQSLSQRFPTRIIRIARDDGTGIAAADGHDAPIDPFSLLRGLR
jgi:hypothetical protein